MRRFAGNRVCEVHIQLERRVAQETEKLDFRRFLDRHQVENQNLQRTNILRPRSFCPNRDDTFLLQFTYGFDAVCYFYWHCKTSCSNSHKKNPIPYERDEIFVLPPNFASASPRKPP